MLYVLIWECRYKLELFGLYGWTADLDALEVGTFSKFLISISRTPTKLRWLFLKMSVIFGSLVTRRLFLGQCIIVPMKINTRG